MKPRERILEAADAIFGEVGFDAASTRAIAERSEVNKALIHYHFKSKDGLFGSLLDRYYERLGAVLMSSLQGEGDPRDRLARLVDAYMVFLRENRNFGLIVQREAAGGRHMERIRAHMAPLFAMGASMLEQAYPSTRTGTLAANQLLLSAYGLIVGYFTYSAALTHLMGGDPMAADAFEARRRHVLRVVDVLLDAVVRDEQAVGRGSIKGG
ncbi:MAG: TetR family transcriptional regulator [Polyangia bacterium]|jgi:AcrR family transcriptional regulator|nr:TetR family transcriptional regulator [Polyangia bacterium]